MVFSGQRQLVDNELLEQVAHNCCYSESWLFYNALEHAKSRENQRSWPTKSYGFGILDWASLDMLKLVSDSS